MSERPYYRACAVLSIIQAHILAHDSTVDPDIAFRGGYLPTDALELAARELSDLLEDLEELENRRKADAAQKAAA
ncbi:hypothetical protein LV780_09580 [Cereibacter azotoformans]|uniref:Uncharacterized protein n=1 Tax=Cereibacter azotoformans TaxID=43057 RepID=A0A2T5JLK7_9RHOB|nr:hypothetical protein [Cereibacter azotoformans]AXQ94022.1 hypothetical protein D0Z66_09600 [Cereibacter sphaeroides]PTR07790.1 hypothetical protein C8J28_13825 [Cereibacter azotoformans]UIJ29552.1 hypothetical protein LV780_09580 [Cereibacter azotoformans]